MNIFIDCDETICHYTSVERKYENALPIQSNIDKINKLYDLGHKITIWTARGTVTQIDYYDLTVEQLKKWNVKYHHLLLGKPSYDLYIDDKSINSIYDWNDNSVNNILHQKQNDKTKLVIKQKHQLNSFFDNINTDSLEKVANYILHYKCIYFVGIGKSEGAAKHTSDTLKSISINSTNLNAQNLSHGDIGGVSEYSLALIYSKSGNTAELEIPLFLLKQKKCFIILISMHKGKLYDKCDFWFQIPFSDELDDLNVIPTTSITYYSIFTNLLVSTIIQKKNIAINDYKHNHISGNIGHKLFTKVKDIYKKKDDICCHLYYDKNLSCKDIIFKITESKIGTCIILNDDDTIYGIITDGGIRNYFIKSDNYNLEQVLGSELINKNPFVISDIETEISEYDNIKHKYAPVTINNKYCGVFKFENF